MKNWPSWIPSPNSWMSAILLVLLIVLFSGAMQLILFLVQLLTSIFPKLGGVAFFLVYLSPIALIAISHHVIHLFLDKFFPDTKSPEMGKVKGILPSLMSCWEGLYGWLVILISILASSAIISMFSSCYHSNYDLKALWLDDLARNIFTLSNLIKVIVAAYLYQFESLVRQHLMSIGSANNSN